MVTTVPPPLPIILGDDVVLVCIITGMDPPDTITWTLNGALVNSGNGNFTLMAVTVADYGVYTCNASNEFGSDSDTVEVIQAGTLFNLAPTSFALYSRLEICSCSDAGSSVYGRRGGGLHTIDTHSKYLWIQSHD